MSFLKNFMITNKKKLITHDGSFHADDIFACATLELVLEKKGEEYEVIRTRDPEIIKTGDYVFDLGGEYTADKNIFDHHQKGGAGKRENGIEYASFGLVWKHFGKELTSSEKVFEFIDVRLAAPVDAWDNGMDLVENKYDVSPYLIQHVFGSMRPTWREKDITNDQMFFKCVAIAKEVLQREITQASDAILAEERVMSIYNNAEDKRLIILDEAYPFEYILFSLPEPIFVVYPRATDGTWGVKAVRQDPKTFDNKKNLPTAWSGLRDEELAKITGVEDAVFCHRALFMAVAKSREGAIKLGQIALQS